MPSLIEKLKNEGVLKGYWDFRAGHYQDLSGNGNHGTAASGAYLTRDGLKNISGSSVTVADSNSLDITEGCFVILGNPTRKTTEMWLGKDAAAADLDYRIYSDTVNFAITDSTNTARGLNFNFSGSNCIALNVKSGETGSVYSNGIFAGNLSGVSTFTAGTKTLYLGTAGYSQTVPAKRPVKAILIISKQLTATEHAQIYDELSKMRWTTKNESILRSALKDDEDLSEMVAKWSLGSTSAKLIDEIGGHDGVGTNGPTIVTTKFGRAIRFIRAKNQHYLLDGDNDFKRSNFTFEMLMRQNSAASAAQVIFSSLGAHYYFGINNTNNPYFVYRESDLTNHFSVGSFSYVSDAWNHVVLSVEAGNGTYAHIKCFVNGKKSIYEKNAKGWASAYGNSFILGSYNGVSSSFDGLLVPMAFYSTAKSDSWILKRYDKFARTVLFSESGIKADNLTTTSGQLSNTSFSVDAGSFRVKATDSLKKNTKVIECINDGILTRPVNYINAAGENTFGTWKFYYKKAAASNLYIALCAQAKGVISSGDYYFAHNSSQTASVGVWGTGSLISKAVTAEIWHKVMVIRNIDGSFELYIDDIKVGESSDASLTSCGYILLSMGAGDEISMSDPVGITDFTKYLGAVRV